MKPGRPIAPALTKAGILQTALTMIDAGQTTLSFRSLATAHGVTPMAIAHHIGTRDQLLADLIALCFAPLTPPSSGDTPPARLRDLLTRYCQTVLHHPNLIPLTFANPALMTGPLRDLTDRLRADLPSDIVLNLTIDYTHGFTLSAAAPPGVGPTLSDYLAGLDWILSHAFPSG
jgi:hypothetical protein